MTEHVQIQARASEVWPWLADPALAARWNPKVVPVERRRTGVVERGERYDMDGTLGNKTTRGIIEVEEIDPLKRMVLRFETANRKPGTFVRVTYELREAQPGVIDVTQRVDFSKSGIPWWARGLIGLLSRWGKPTGKPVLEALRDLVEKRGA